MKYWKVRLICVDVVDVIEDIADPDPILHNIA